VLPFIFTIYAFLSVTVFWSVTSWRTDCFFLECQSTWTSDAQRPLQLWLMSLSLALFGAGLAEPPGCLPCWLICCTTIVMGTICVEDSEYCGGCLDDIDIVLWCSPTHRLIQTGSDKLKQQLSSRQNLMVPTRCAVAAKCTFVH
jgi:hypothetical protein